MIPMLNRVSQNNGFTLLEVVIALGLLTTALLAVFRLQAQNLDLQYEAQFITIANQLARDRIARTQASVDLTEGTASGDFGEVYPNYFYREEISRVPDVDALYKIHLSVVFERDAIVKDLSLETYLFRAKK